MSRQEKMHIGSENSEKALVIIKEMIPEEKQPTCTETTGWVPQGQNPTHGKSSLRKIQT